MNLFAQKSDKLTRASEVEIPDKIKHRISTSIPALDDAFGGGLVRGSVTLFGGEPGVGKSTLLIQLLDAMSNHGSKCVYDSAEEAMEQLKMMYQRVNATGDFLLGPFSEVGELATAVEEYKADLLVVDSIQGFHVKEVDARVGSPTQLKESCNNLIRFAKDHTIALIVICQYTKEGGFRGPKDLEHNVDIVGNLTTGKDPDKYRVLMFSKNRFGPTQRAKHIPWLSKEGRYDLDPKAIIETVEQARVPLIQAPKAGGRIHMGQETAPAMDHVQLIAHELRAYREPTNALFLSIVSSIRAKYGPFRIGETDHAVFGMTRDKFKTILAFLAHDHAFTCQSQDPVIIGVV